MPHIEHVLFFKLNPLSKEQYQALFDCGMGLKDKIPGILEISMGPHEPINPNDRTGGYTHGFRVKFPDAASLNAYAPHPEHQKFVALLAEARASPPLCLDWIVNFLYIIYPDFASYLKTIKNTMSHIEHIIFLKLRSHSKEQYAAIHAGAIAMKVIPGVIDVSFGPHALVYSINASAGFTHGLRITFTNEETLQAYAEHEIHVKFGVLLGELIEGTPISLDWIV